MYTRRQELICTEDQMIAKPGVVLRDGEVIRIRMNNGQIYEKMGDGVTPIIDLPYNINSEFAERAEKAADRAEAVRDNFVTPEMFGAVGDGVTDDTVAIVSALNTGKPLMLCGTYAVSSEMSGSAPKIIGQNAKIVLLNDINKVFRLIETNYISGLSFDGNNFGATSCVFVTDTESVEISNIDVKNIRDTRVELGSTLIFAYEIPIVHIHDVRIENCSHIVNGTIGDSAGNISGIYVSDYSKQCVIENIVGDEIHNIDASGNIVLEDSNLIYVTSMSKNANTIIRNVYGRNFGKRLIKTQCNHTVIVDGVTSYSNSPDHLVTIGIQSTENAEQTEYGSGIITNCFLENAFIDSAKKQSQNLIATSERVTISNCILISPQQMSILNSGDTIIRDCEIIGAGILENGRTLKCDGVTYKGSSFITTPSGSSISKNQTIINSKLHYESSESALSYGFFEVYGESYFIANNEISGGAIWLIRGNGTVKDLLLTGGVGSDAIYLVSGSLELSDCKIYADEGEGHARAIQAVADTVFTVRDCITYGYSFNIVNKGNIVIKGGLDLTKLYAINSQSLVNRPEYVETLPSPSLLPQGTRVILASDNKLYNLVNSEWVAVGANG